jgi:hypothetical protein
MSPNPKLTGRARARDARRKRTLKWSARDGAAKTYHGPL